MDFERELSFRFPLDRGEDVRAVQLALTVLQTTPPCGIADGIYGNATKLAVAGFQRSQGLFDDGVVSQKTWTSLFTNTKDKQVPEPAINRVSSALASQKDMPLSQAQGLRVHQWLTANFGPAIQTAIEGTRVDAALVSAIVCKETANVWLGWISKMSPGQILARCVFDGSGDVPGTSRSAFPQNTAAFRARYGDALTDMLIAEANATRRLRGYNDKQWVYKGYGPFQYDLQHIDKTPDFFKNRQWGSMTACLDRFMSVMTDKLNQAQALHEAVRMYNGSGTRAQTYADQVMEMRGWF
ncbi:peptidoglycan-binding domain-containing protein [Paraburkholderia terrae]|uniref:peptidoglycan-binding domain-containing protein n=1 Tax=Paraburkholderia terrae TaxID=311230 RepID=UPI0020638C98|nr:peptidoglycan-binding protein [Paraburkholderia terrae]BDC46010.1 hypothetical protein PTKU15_93070 [Paraburkholderia terrae]